MNILHADFTPRPIRSAVPHKHPNREIILTFYGSYTSEIGGVRYELQKGDILVIPPGLMHHETSDSFYRNIFIQTDCTDFPDEVFKVHDDDNGVYALMKVVTRVFSEKGDNYKQILNSVGESIFLFINKYRKQVCRYPFVSAIKNLAFEHIPDESFNINEAISGMGYNKDYVRRVFFKEIGQTPSEYLMALRISRAKDLLLYDEAARIAEIAAKCGYKDSYYFTRVFKKHTGLSPSALRRGGESAAPIYAECVRLRG